MASAMSLMADKNAGISVLSSWEPNLERNALVMVMIQNKGGMFSKNHSQSLLNSPHIRT
jgi:hypothetical protein